MKKKIQKAILALVVAYGGASATPVISIVFNNSPQTGLAGNTLTLIATMTNTSGSTQNLNGDGFSLPSPFTTANINDSAFFTNWPSALNASQSFGPQALFDITIPNGTAVGSYTGTFNLLGGPGANDQNLIGTASFQVNVTTPEPGSGVLGLLGLAALAFARRPRRHGCQPPASGRRPGGL